MTVDTSNNDSQSASSTASTDAQNAKKEMEKKNEPNNPPPKPKPLFYPLHADLRYPVEVKFEIMSQEGAQVEGLTDFASGLKKKYDAFVASVKAGEAVEFEEPPESEAPKAKPAERKDIFKSIHLYLPQGFATNDALQYSNADLGLTGAVGMDALNSGGSTVNALMSMFKAGFGSLTDAAGNSGDLARLTVSRNANGLLKGILPAEAELALTMSAAVTVNPNTRAMFKGVGLRSFQFQFKFIPVSQKEAEEVEAIIKRFREHAYPEPIKLTSTDVVAGFKFPHLFNISLTAHGKPVGTKLKTCVLESIQTNYNPSAMAWHSDGKPTEYDLSLSFREEVTLNAEDVRNGF